MSRTAIFLRGHRTSRPPMSDGERRALAARAWHDLGIVCILPAEIRNEFDRQAVINAAVRLYGERKDDAGT